MWLYHIQCYRNSITIIVQVISLCPWKQYTIIKNHHSDKYTKYRVDVKLYASVQIINMFPYNLSEIANRRLPIVGHTYQCCFRTHSTEHFHDGKDTSPHVYRRIIIRIAMAYE